MVTGSARHSPSNGGIERFNRTIQAKVTVVRISFYIACLLFSFICFFFESSKHMQMRTWLEDNNSTNWPLAAKMCTFSYNTSHHKGINKVCYASDSLGCGFFHTYNTISTYLTYYVILIGALRGCVWATTQGWHQWHTYFQRFAE